MASTTVFPDTPGTGASPALYTSRMTTRSASSNAAPKSWAKAAVRL